jgi:hypothetical protein
MKARDVIWISDDEISPPGPKMVVCVEPFIGLYYRINTHDNWRPCILIDLHSHAFLKHDSFIQCEILELDDYVITQALNKGGVIGRISISVCDALIEALGYVNAPHADKNSIRSALERAKLEK